jgi:hypothetical protein
MEAQDEHERSRLFAFKRWRQHIPLLYEQFTQHQRFPSPTTTVDFLPGWCARHGGWGHQQLVTACKNENDTQQLYFLVTPVLSDASVARAIPLETSIAEFELPFFSDITRVRHMPQVPSLLAVKGPEGVQLLRSPQAEVSNDDNGSISNSEMRSSQDVSMTGDETEAEGESDDNHVAWVIGTLGSGSSHLPEPQGVGLAWSPGSVGSLLSTSADGSIIVYRVDVDDSPVDATGPTSSQSIPTIGQAQVLSGQHVTGEQKHYVIAYNTTCVLFCNMHLSSGLMWALRP